MTYPTVTSQDFYLQALEDMDTGVEGAREAVIAAQHDPSVPLGRLYTHYIVFAPTPSVDTLPHTPMLLDESGPSQFPWILPPVFMGTPVSQPTSLGTKTTWIQNLDGMVTTQMLALDTLAGEAGTPPPPHFFPLGEKLAKKRAPSENTELSMFDILNIFWHHWFLSVGHLRAQALSAQKANNGKIIWVEFAPQFHAHLVKCAIVLVPWPIAKVKKVMFVYILELLNKDSHLAFFDLTKGDQWATVPKMLWFNFDCWPTRSSCISVAQLQQCSSNRYLLGVKDLSWNAQVLEGSSLVPCL
jgi:hypothetical protein